MTEEQEQLIEALGGSPRHQRCSRSTDHHGHTNLLPTKHPDSTTGSNPGITPQAGRNARLHIATHHHATNPRQAHPPPKSLLLTRAAFAKKFCIEINFETEIGAYAAEWLRVRLLTARA